MGPHRALIASALTLVMAMPAAAAERSVDALVAEATAGLTQFTFDLPQPLFRQARERSTPGDANWQAATYGLAVCRQQLAPIRPEALAEAGALYAELVQKVPTSRFAPRAELNLGRIAELVDFFEDPIDLPGARTHYEKVIAGWPDLPIAGEATLRIAGTYVQENTAESIKRATALLDGWLAAHPKDPLASAMYQYLGDTHFFYLDDRVKAVAAYRKADEVGLMWRGRESIIWWRIAAIAEQTLKDRKLAVRYYTKICTEAQTSGRAFEAQIALARLGAPVPELTAFAAYPGKRPDLDGTPPATPGAGSAPTGATP